MLRDGPFSYMNVYNSYLQYALEARLTDNSC